MSQLKVNTIRHTGASSDAVTLATDGTCTAKITNNLSNRNLIINGAMRVSQRGSTFNYTSTTSYGLDRWRHTVGSSFNFDTTMTQDSSGPDGFIKCLKVTPDSAVTPTGSHNGAISQRLEGQDCQSLCHGTSSAKKVTLSFYAKSGSQNNNHQYGVQLFKTTSGGSTFNVTKAFTITSSWQKFTMTFPGDTSNDIGNDNSERLRVIFNLATGPDDISSEVSTWTASNIFRAVTGQDNFMDNTSNEFYLTGVQLEVGDVATDFEHRSYGDELARCQRYFWKSFPDGIAPAKNLGNTDSIFSQVVTGYNGSVIIPISMRTDPTLVFYNPSADNSNNSSSGATATNRSTSNGIFVEWGSVAGNFYTQITASAEL